MEIRNIPLIIVLLFVHPAEITFAAELPPYLKVCSRHLKEFSACLVQSVKGLQPIFVNGDPSRGVPSLEPLDVGDLIIADHAGGAGGLKISATNISAGGASKFEIVEIRGSYENLDVSFEVLIPKLDIVGRYGVDGNILTIPIKGHGPFTATFFNCTAKAYMTAEIYKKNGVDFFRFTDMKIGIKFQKGRMHLKNLFGGDNVLGEIINQTINSNFDILSQDIIPLIEKALSKLFLRFSNKIVDPYTLDQLYPDIP